MTTLVIDNVLKDFNAAREAVLAHQFKEETGPDGHQYLHITQEAQPKVELEKRLSKFFKDIDWRLTFWRQDWAGEFPHSFCHADKICADYAALFYAMPPELCVGGTCFYKHKGTGWDHLPTDAELKASGVEPHRFHPWMTAETKSEANWTLDGVVSMKPNRLVVYPTKVWHARYPAEGSGTSQEDGRMVWVGFFNATPR